MSSMEFSVGRERALTGSRGEDYARFFLSHFFTARMDHSEGSAVDLTCRGFRAAPQSKLFYRNPTLQFHFQVKDGKSYWKDGFRVTRSTFESWLRLFETEPVVLLYVKELTVPQVECWFLVLHRWLLQLPQFLVSDRKPGFNIRQDFIRVDDDLNNLHEALRAEADRATQAAGSPWATLRDYGLLPFNEGQFLKYLELAPFAEIPQKVLLELTDDLRAQVPLAVERLFQGAASGSAIVQDWWESLQGVFKQERSAGSFARRQFRQFVDLMHQDDPSRIGLPPFNVAAVGCWRAFVAMYPHSLGVLKGIIETSQRENDLVFTAALVAVLGNSDDERLRADSIDVLKRLENRLQDFASYRYRREIRRSLAEAGLMKHLDPAISVLQQASKTEELNYLSGYGWIEELLEDNIERKLVAPTRRDVNLALFYEAMADKVLG